MLSDITNIQCLQLVCQVNKTARRAAGARVLPLTRSVKQAISIITNRRLVRVGMGGPLSSFQQRSKNGGKSAWFHLDVWESKMRNAVFRWFEELGPICELLEKASKIEASEIKSPVGRVFQKYVYSSFMVKMNIKFGSFRLFWFNLGWG